MQFFKAMALPVSLIAICLAGCDSGGPALQPVTGKVLVDDQPLGGATVSFYNAEAPPAMAVTNDKGEFTLMTEGKPGAVVGDFAVAVSKKEAVSAAQVTPAEMAEMAKAGKMPTPPKDLIPAKYGMATSSGLTAAVKSGKNTFEFKLSSK